MSVTSVLLDILIVLIAAKVAAEIAERSGTRPSSPTVLGAAVQALEAPATPGAEVDFDDDGSPWYTLCEVRCVDRPGLLHAVTVGFASAGIDVHSAQVRTLAGVAVDRFELTDRNGRKVGDAAKRVVIDAVTDGARVARRRRLPRRNGR